MRKIQSLILAVALVMVAFVHDNVSTDAAATPAVTLTALTTPTRLEVGDTVTIGIKISGITEMSYMHAKLDYDTNIFETVTGAGIEIDTNSQGDWDFGWDQDEKLVQIYYRGNTQINGSSGQTVLTGRIPGTNIATVTLKVKRAVDANTTVYMKDISVVDGNQNVITAADTSIQMTNSMSSNRKVTLEIENANNFTMYPNKGVDIPVKIKENSGFDTVKLEVAYDPTKLSFDSITWSDKAKAQSELRNINPIAGALSVSMINSKKDITLANEEFMYLHFTCASSIGETTIVTVTIREITNFSDTTITSGVNNNASCSITAIAEPSYSKGDVDMDGDVDLVDAVKLLRHYNGLITLNSRQLELGDVNNSSTINLVDVLLIMKYCNGEISSF